MDNVNNRKLVFYEPHVTGGDSTITITESKAIKWMQTQHPKLTSSQALTEFIVIHWAEYLEDK